MSTNKMPMAILIGRGSRLPAILEYAQSPNSAVEIKIVVSHKKLESDGSDVPGITLAKKHGIPAVYFNLPLWRKHLGKTREEFEETLGFFLSQPYYAPKLVFMTGWDLLMGKNFLKFFPWENGFYRVINVHPGLLPDNPEDDEVLLSNGQKVPAIRGRHGVEAIQAALEQKHPIAGSTIHFVTEKLDNGPVICRAEVRVKSDDAAESLYPRIQAEEDKMGPYAIDLFARGKLKIKGHRVVIQNTTI